MPRAQRVAGLASWPLLGAVAISISCTGPRVKLPVRGDDDDDDDVLIPCDADTPCEHSLLQVCGPRGFCVECTKNSHCAGNEYCELDFECERIGGD